MKNKILIVVIMFGLISCAPTTTADLDKASAAAQKGDYRTAVKVWKPLAEQGNAVAQFHMGEVYEFGMDDPQNRKQAIKWFRSAAKQGNADAQHKLGLMYATGFGLPENEDLAIEWLTRAATQGHATSQNFLDALYRSQKRGSESNK